MCAAARNGDHVVDGVSMRPTAPVTGWIVSEDRSAQFAVLGILRLGGWARAIAAAHLMLWALALPGPLPLERSPAVLAGAQHRSDHDDVKRLGGAVATADVYDQAPDLALGQGDPRGVLACARAGTGDDLRFALRTSEGERHNVRID
jgi:hypothetical protein